MHGVERIPCRYHAGELPEMVGGLHWEPLLLAPPEEPGADVAPHQGEGGAAEGGVGCV